MQHIFVSKTNENIGVNKTKSKTVNSIKYKPINFEPQEGENDAELHQRKLIELQ